MVPLFLPYPTTIPCWAGLVSVRAGVGSWVPATRYLTPRYLPPSVPSPGGVYPPTVYLPPLCLSWPRNPVFCDFPPVVVRSAKTQDVKKLRNFGEELLGTDFFPKSAPSSRKLYFSVFGPEILAVPRGCPSPKGPKIPVFCDLSPVGVQ